MKLKFKLTEPVLRPETQDDHVNDNQQDTRLLAGQKKKRRRQQ